MNKELKKTDSENIEEIIPDASRKTKVFPSEIGSWEYCNLKWLYERPRKSHRVIES